MSKATKKQPTSATREHAHVFAKAMASYGQTVLASAVPEVEATVEGRWAEARLVITGTPDAVAKATALLDELEPKALDAMTDWQKTAPERAEQTGYQRRVGSRSFLAGYGAAVAARLAGKPVRGSKADDAATRAGRTAGKTAELGAA